MKILITSILIVCFSLFNCSILTEKQRIEKFKVNESDQKVDWSTFDELPFTKKHWMWARTRFVEELIFTNNQIYLINSSISETLDSGEVILDLFSTNIFNYTYSSNVLVLFEKDESTSITLIYTNNWLIDTFSLGQGVYEKVYD